MRMPNGAGSVYKLTDTARRRPWVAAVSAGYTRSGCSKRTVIGYYETKPDALRALLEFQKHPTDKLKLTLGEVFTEWSGTHFQRIGASMTQNYTSAWSRLRVLENERLRDLRTAQLQRVIDTHSGLSQSSLEKTKGLMLQLFRYAVQNDILDKNYAEFVRLPKFDRTEKEVFSETELSVLKEAAGTVPYADWILVLCCTGFRIGEFLKLTRSSYDPTHETLTGGSKTAAGRNRVVPVHPLILPVVRTWLDKGGETIFCDNGGRGVPYRRFMERIWTPTLKTLGLRPLTPHSARHTFATLLNKGGASTADTQKLIGHASYATTADIYTHQDLQTLRAAIGKIGI